MRLRSLPYLMTVTAFILLTAGPPVDAQVDERYPHLMRGMSRPSLRGPGIYRVPQGAYRPTVRAARPVFDSRHQQARRPAPPRALPNAQPEPLIGEMPPEAVLLPDGTALPGTETQHAAPVGTIAPALPVIALPAPAGPTLNIHVLGDSMGEMLAQGLRDVYASRPEIVIHRRARGSSGLVRDDYFDWPRAVRELLSSSERIDVAFMMIGSNDRQALRDDSGSHEPGSERWRELYAQRVESITGAFREKRVPLVWVGMPVMRSQQLSQDVAVMNSIAREKTQRAELSFLDIWESFSDESGRYNAAGPDVSGQSVRIRAGDGVHFTRAGARKLAFFTEKELKRFTDNAQALSIAAAPAARLPALPPGLLAVPAVPDAGAAVRDAIAPPRSDLRLASAPDLNLLPPELPAFSTLTPRPPAGPVTSLTRPMRSEGGKLLEGRFTETNRDPLSDAQSVLRAGQPVRAKQGRADDFSWRGPAN